MPWRSASQSITRPDSSAKAATMAGSASCPFLRWISAAMISALSGMSFSA